MSIGFYRDPEFNERVPKSPARRQFKLIELLFVIAIIAVVVAALMPSTSHCNGPLMRRVQCMNNLKQIALALLEYEKDFGAFPPAYTIDAQGRPLHSWRTLILPYLEQEDLYKTIDLSKPWSDPANAKALEASVPVFRCPEATRPLNSTTYLSLVGRNACLLPTKPRRLAEITDSHSSTLMVIEAGDENAVPWMAPRDADESLVLSFGAPNSNPHHPGGMSASFVDGSVRFIKGNTKPDVLRALFSISGGEKTSDY